MDSERFMPNLFFYPQIDADLANNFPQGFKFAKYLKYNHFLGLYTDLIAHNKQVSNRYK